MVPNATQRVDFILEAGLLQAIPQPLIVRVDPGGIETRILDMLNTGARAAAFDIAELDAPPVALGGLRGPLRGPLVDPDRAAALRARASSPALRNGRTARGLTPLGAPWAPSLSGGNVVANYATNLSDGWGVAFNTDAGDFWIANSALFAGDDLDYRYLTDGTQTGDTIDDSAWVADFAADGAYNPRTEKLWRVNVGGDDCIYEWIRRRASRPGTRSARPSGCRSAVSRTTWSRIRSIRAPGRTASFSTSTPRGRYWTRLMWRCPSRGWPSTPRTAGCTP